MTYYPISQSQTGLITKLASTISDTYARWQKARAKRRQQRIDRLAFQNLLHLDPHLLDDVGYQRHEVEQANSLPLNSNAAIVLLESRRRRRAKQQRHNRRVIR